MNPGDASAAERFKRMTNAYSRALLISAKREREGPQAAAADQAKYRTRATAATSPRTSTWGGSWREDSSRFNHREWDRAHYGLHGATAEARQSEYIRNLANAQRARAAAAGQARVRRQQGRRMGSGGSSFSLLLGSFIACCTVWRAVYETNRDRYIKPSGGRR